MKPYAHTNRSCPYTVTGVHEPNVIMKDSDLKYKIRLPLEVAMDLLKQIQMDADFLLSLGIMDYSLLGTNPGHCYITTTAVQLTTPNMDFGSN